DITVGDGTADFSSDPNSPFAATSLTLNGNGADLTGTTDLTISGLFHWTYGTLAGSGQLNANGGILMDGDTRWQLSDDNKFLDGRTVNNAGTAVWTGGHITAYNGAVINNLAGATFESRSGYDMTYAQYGFTGGLGGEGALATFHNAGMFIKTGDRPPITPNGVAWGDVGDGTQMDVIFENSGVVDAQVGTIGLYSLGR